MLHPNLPRRRLHPYLLLAAWLWLLCCAAAGCGGGDDNRPSPAPAQDTLSGSLPRLSELADKPAGVRKHVSETTYELLTGVPAAQSAEGATVSAGSLSLDPVAAGGLAWAVFKLSGFPDDGAVYPTAVAIDKDLPAPCYIGVSNYQRGTWDFAEVFSTSPTVPLSGAAGLLSPATGARAFYVAVLADEFALHATSLRVTCSADLPGGPNAALNVLSTKNAFGWPTRFDASGSDGGDGTITSITYDFGDGSPTYSPPSADPTEVVEHTYMSVGAKIATVTVENDQARSDIDGAGVDVADTEKEVLVVYNYNIPESQDLAMYYSSPETGRTIDRQYILGLTLLGADVGIGAKEDVDRTTYNSAIRDPIKTWLDGNPSFKANIKYILLCKGVPLKINSDGPASVDSELCLLYSDLGEASGGYSYADFLINDYPGMAKIFGVNSTGFYMSGDEQFQVNHFQVSQDPTWGNPPSGDEEPFTLNYLVGRLTAYTWDEAKLLVDRSLNADTSGQGWTIFDSTVGTYGNGSDTMVDPVWPWTDPDDAKSGEELLKEAGYNVFADVTADKIYYDYVGLDPGAADHVIGYCSWGVHNGNPPTYILDNLGFTYLPGACFNSYESFNAWDTDAPTDADIQRQGQGQICDFFRMGGTVAIGNVYEPYTIGCGDERWAYSRYMIDGDRWIEAAYKGLRLASWMEVIVGDPLCRVKP